MFRPLVNSLRNALNKKPTRTAISSSRNARAGLIVEQMESRDLMSVTSAVSTSLLQTVNLNNVGIVLPPWKPMPTAAGFALINGLSDPTVRAAALTDYTNDGQITATA